MIVNRCQPYWCSVGGWTMELKPIGIDCSGAIIAVIEFGAALIKFGQAIKGIKLPA